MPEMMMNLILFVLGYLCSWDGHREQAKHEQEANRRKLADRAHCAQALGVALVDAMVLDPAVFPAADHLASLLSPTAADALVAAVSDRAMSNPLNVGLRVCPRPATTCWPTRSDAKRKAVDDFQAAFQAWSSSK